MAINIESAALKTFSEQYGPFNDTNTDIFEIIRTARISKDYLLLTQNALNAGEEGTPLSFNAARILLKQLFRLWENHVIDLSNSTFYPTTCGIFQHFIYDKCYRLRNDISGEGFAFVIAPDLLLPGNRIGQFLGLTNSQSDNSSFSGLIAVEFDSFKQSFDPDGNDVGIDVLSIVSRKAVSLTAHNISIPPIGATFHNIWVDYDGINMVIDVYIAKQTNQNGATPPKPRFPVLSLADLNHRDHVDQYSYFGFSASRGNDTQFLSLIVEVEFDCPTLF